MSIDEDEDEEAGDSSFASLEAGLTRLPELASKSATFAFEKTQSRCGALVHARSDVLGLLWTQHVIEED